MIAAIGYLANTSTTSLTLARLWLPTSSDTDV